MSEYQPGVCNIGPPEIARRRRAGHVAAVAAVSLAAGLIAVGAPRAMRLIVALPAASAASGYLQARHRFCAGFGSRGVVNFGPVGEVTEVVDPQSHALDVAASRRIGLRSLAIGLAAAGVAVAAPPWRAASSPRPAG